MSDDAAGGGGITLVEPHQALVGRITVRRVLPRRTLRTVGAWCFTDVMGPVEVTETSGLDVGPHPHMGLQTVTWLMDGAALHRDSLGSEQLIRPGQLNLMTAGRGISHSEEATGTYRGSLFGVQLWVAQPDADRDGPPAFAHHADLPRVDAGLGEATVLAGEFMGARSPAAFASDLVGADIRLHPGRATWALRRDFEHAVVALTSSVCVSTVTATAVAAPGHLAYLAPGHGELTIDAGDDARVLLLGGVPFAEPIVMWWNFVGRSREEIIAAQRQWQGDDGRFGDVDSRLTRINAPDLLWRERPAPRSEHRRRDSNGR